MSGFDSNPFADPEGSNPFSDPSVTQHTDAAQKGLEEYNPFADDGAAAAAPETAASAPVVPNPAPPLSYQPAELPTSKPAMMEPAPPVYGEQFPGENEPIVAPETNFPEEPLPKQPTRPAAAPVTPTGLTPEQELELARREPNFPPCLKIKGCPVKPCFFHNIALEIPQDRKKFVRLLFFFWQFYCFTLFVNFIACAAIFGADNDSSIGVNFGFSILWFVLFIPCSFYCWYWCAYNAFRTDSSLRFMIFFFVFFFQFVSCVVFGVGITQAGGAGMIVTLSVKGNTGVFVLGMIAFVLWVLGAVVSFILLIQIHRFYRTSGYTVEKMQAEASTAVAQNEGVRKAVVAGVKGSMQS